MKGSALGRGAAAAGLGTALSRVTGFIRLAAAAYAVGATESRIADTYRLANSTPNILFELAVGGVLSAVVLRVYIEVRDTEGPEEAWLFLSRLTKLTLLVLSALTIIGVLAAPLIIKAYTFRAPGAGRVAQQQVGTALLRLFVPQIIFYGMSYISDAVLRAHQRFGVVMVAPVLNNLIVTATFLTFAATVPERLRRLELLSTGEILLLGLGTTIGVALLGLTPFLYMRRVGFRFVAGSGFRDPRLKRFGKMSLYQFGYVAINQMGLWVALVLANRVQGGVTGYVDSFVFFQLPHGLLAVSISVVVHTALTERAVAQDFDGYRDWFSKGARAVAFSIAPAVAGYIALSPLIVRMLLQHGFFTEQSTDLIARVLRIWAPGILFFSLFYLVLRGFYALGDTRTPMFINFGAFGVNVLVNLTLFSMFDDPVMKVAGLAVGHSASYLFAFIVGIVLLRRRVGGGVSAGLASTMLRVIPASGLTGLAAWFTASLFGATDEGLVVQIVRVTVATAVGLLIYVAALSLVRSEELRWWKQIIVRRSRVETS